MTWLSSAARVGHGRETTFGTAATINRSFGIYNQDLDLPDKEVEQLKYRTFGFGRKWFKIKGGKRTRTASHSIIPTSGEFFYYAFGNETFTSGTPNTHLMETLEETARLPSFTFGVYLPGDNNWRRRFRGCVVNTLNVSLSEGREVNIGGDILAKTQTDDASSFSAPTISGEPYMFYDVSSNISIGGATFAKLKDFNFTLNNNLNTRHFIQDSDARDPFTYTTSYPDFGATMSVVPSGFLSGQTDSVYHLLEDDDNTFDITLTLSRGGTDELKFFLDDCGAQSSPHGLHASGEEVDTTFTVSPSNIRVQTKDSLAEYGTL